MQNGRWRDFRHFLFFSLIHSFHDFRRAPTRSRALKTKKNERDFKQESPIEPENHSTRNCIDIDEKEIPEIPWGEAYTARLAPLAKAITDPTYGRSRLLLYFLRKFRKSRSAKRIYKPLHSSIFIVPRIFRVLCFCQHRGVGIFLVVQPCVKNFHV